jgi:hypothetical protein
MRLFDMVNNQLVISEEAYTLLPFKKIWDRDKTKLKEKALAELAYVYFMEDYKSDFSDIIDDLERSKEILPALSLPASWKEDDVIVEARKFYRKRSEEIIPLILLRDSKVVIDKMSEYFREVDFLANDDKGKPKYDIDKLARVIERSAGILQNLFKLEHMVKKEVQDKKDTVGSKTKALFEDGV